MDADNFGPEPMDIDGEWEWSYESGDDSEDPVLERDPISAALDGVPVKAPAAEQSSERAKEKENGSTDFNSNSAGPDGGDEIDALIKGAKRKVTRIVWDRGDEEDNGERGREKNEQSSRKKKRRRKPQKINIEKFVNKVCWRLQEKKFFLVWRLVDTVGIQGLQTLMKEVEAIEEAGGQMTAGGDRRRTPGGVLWNILKERMEPALYKELMAPEIEAKKELKKRQSRRKRSRMAIDKKDSSKSSEDQVAASRDANAENMATCARPVWDRISKPRKTTEDDTGGEDLSEGCGYGRTDGEDRRRQSGGSLERDLPERWECIRDAMKRNGTASCRDGESYRDGYGEELDMKVGKSAGHQLEGSDIVSSAVDRLEDETLAADFDSRGGQEEGEWREDGHNGGEDCGDGECNDRDEGELDVGVATDTSLVLERSIADKIAADLRPKEDWQTAWVEAVRGGARAQDYDDDGSVR